MIAGFALTVLITAAPVQHEIFARPVAAQTVPASRISGSTSMLIVRPVPGPPGYDDSDLLAVGQFLIRHGYSRAGAAGIAGCIAGESGGNPESVGSGGGGLIGWTPLPDGLVTGNPGGDLATQEQAILAYNQGRSASLPGLNNQTDPVTAADVYSQHFEAPAAPLSDVRDSVAEWVFSQLDRMS